ncbi:hypothetical protein EVAR_88311_1 [Eumeta japonica]|uniref:Uncharacterized protein n=1 Tax=Eumeta variegata TaxID=151549 RepID=A0A4C1VNS5_EUMVA|nr:hypothetical protein EVAR_88311_1 [Eumeta japonica]
MRYILVLVQVLIFVYAQDGVRTIISDYLVECYSEPGLLDRNNLPPMTLPVLLDIIRKIEEHPNLIGNLRQISTFIVHTFRQDGIIYDPNAAGTLNVVPYSPTGFPSYKNRLLLNKLIPNNQFHLPNNLLSSEDKCALHYMLSSSIDLHARSDEEWTCNRVETSRSTNERLSHYAKSLDVETFDIREPVDHVARIILGRSRCPTETGVVSTVWGPVSMGTVVTGVASGMEEQNVLVSDLVTLTSGFENNRTIIVNNRYASTIAGDIAEAAVRQGTTAGNVLSVGALGGWNSTNLRRHYFLTKNTNVELTDAEIRGGLDGIILSELGAAYAQTFSELKLSQLIDMYYNHNGVMHQSRFRACNRKVLVPDVASIEILQQHTLGPAVALYHVSSLSGTSNLRGIQAFVESAVTAFRNYIPENIDDPVCRLANDQVIRTKLDLILIAEPTAARSFMVSYLVERLEISRHGSSITFMDSQTGDVLVDRSYSISHFYTEFAKKIVARAGGLNLLKVFESLRTLLNTHLEFDQSQHYSGGHASVALILADTVPLAGQERVQAATHLNFIRQVAPDLRLIFVTTSASEAVLADLLQDRADLIPVTLSAVSASAEELAPAVTALTELPRRIVNPLCGPDWIDRNSGTVGFDDYVDAVGVNLYRLIPNYFYRSTPNQMLRIQSTNHGPLSVCYSRSNTFPRRNRTTSETPGDVICESAANRGAVEIPLTGACEGYSSISSCPPFHFTVASTTIPVEPQCTEYKRCHVNLSDEFRDVCPFTAVNNKNNNAV